MTEPLIVYTEEPFVMDWTRRWEQEITMKPHGLWVSVGDDWERWCRGEEFRTETLAHRSQVTLVDHPNVLVIDNSERLLSFTIEHEADPPWLNRSTLPRPDMLRGYHIDWPLVAYAYDGIIIAPYLWSCRLDHRTFWYYGWDCASGCIWDLRCIAEVTPLLTELTP